MADAIQAAEQDVGYRTESKKLLPPECVREFATNPQANNQEFSLSCAELLVFGGNEPGCIHSLWFMIMPSTPTKPCVLASILAVSPMSPPASSCMQTMRVYASDTDHH